MKINYFTPIEMIHGLESKLKGGHVAVVSSLVAFSSGGIYFGTYGASKGAIWHYLSSLRQEYKKYKKNISISIACPYAINTGMFHGIKMAFEFLIPVLD
jgi:all-trans-retinol dehydrogenase (NAD+)